MRARAGAGVPKGKLFLLPQEIQEINVKDHPPPGISGGCQRKEKASHRQAPCPMGRRNPRKIGGFLIHTRKDLESVPPLLIHIGDVG